MQQSLTAEYTTFTLDTMGRYLANTLQEALDSTTPILGDSRRDFDVIVIGGGPLGAFVREGRLFTKPKKKEIRLLPQGGLCTGAPDVLGITRSTGEFPQHAPFRECD